MWDSKEQPVMFIRLIPSNNFDYIYSPSWLLDNHSIKKI